MNRLGQQIERIERIISQWERGTPLSRHLSSHFAAHRNMGARDRRMVRAWVYAWFRLGCSLPDLPFGKRLAIACYLASTEHDAALDALLDSALIDKDWPDLQASLVLKLSAVEASYLGFTLENIFPAAQRVSDRIDRSSFFHGIFNPPELWIRIRKRYRDVVLKELSDKSIAFSLDPEMPEAVRLPNRTSIDQLDSTRSHRLEVQDRSSQATALLFDPRPGEEWWDACAGSGGKSLLLLDQHPEVKLTVTDRRPSILKNLQERFRLASIKPPRIWQCDLADASSNWPEQSFDVILADVPCSGSGTWTRKPEGLSTRVDNDFFQRFRVLQQSILTNLTTSLKPGGRLIYLTCSVFAAENEEVVQWAQEHLGLELEKMNYFEGYPYRADTLFGARFIKA